MAAPGAQRSIGAALLLAAVLTGCAADAGDDPTPAQATASASATASATSTAPDPDCPAPTPPAAGVAFDEQLHDELLAMLERDQAGRLGTGPDDEGDAARTERLAAIIEQHGWPTFDLVGEDGEDAAWAIAQHADLDPGFQRCALEHLRAAVDAGQASPGNLAYLDDRIQAAAGEPQRYGTQVACTDAGPEPATPLADADAIERLRAEAGLEPYDDYLAEMAEICALPD
ncbi:DUF6624 domain-containing protein [Agrococcus citreus]|uniref:Lipoprotein n=1 Tax=Agrococcus citreus TaxID=84643 RepID=A0ABN1YVW7_9MICO